MLHLRNTLGRTKQPFIPLAEVLERPQDGCFVSMYTCGPTVYDYASIGNFSAYLMADLVKRYLLYLGYPVRHIINITDVGHLTADADTEGDDKLEVAAQKEGLDPHKIAAKYTAQFLADAKALHIDDAVHAFPKASDHIPQMLELITRLVELGFAYVTKSAVYFDVTKDIHYGELSGNSLDALKAGARVEVHPDKKHPSDFALWKLNQPTHIMQWDSPWGIGYPGWHIECSAMARHYLGDTIDIHTGGEDNIFPHHECEIAQSESALDIRPFVRFWLHRQFLTVDGHKMSKSAGNTYRLQDIIDHGFSPADFRMLVLSAHYRTGVNFTWEALKAAHERRLHWRALAQKETHSDIAHHTHLELLTRALDDDLNTPNAFAVIEEHPSRAMFEVADKIFALDLFEVEAIHEDYLDKAAKLDVARASNDYALADSLRAELITAGFEVSTSKDVTVISKN